MATRTRGDDTPTEPEGITRDLFVAALQAVQPAIIRDALIDQSEQVLLDGDRLMSYDGEVAISHPLPIDVKGAVFAKELLALLKKLPANEIELVDEGAALLVHSGTLEAGFNIARDIPVPILGLDAVKEWFGMPVDYLEGIAACFASVSTDPTKGVLNYIIMNGDKIFSCDNYCATVFESTEQLPEGVEIRLHFEPAKILAKYVPVEFGFGGSWVHFRNAEGVVVSCDYNDDAYNDVLALFADDGVEIEFPQEVAQKLSVAEIMADKDARGVNKVVKISFDEPDFVTVRAEREDRGWITDKIPYKSDEKKPNFTISPEMLAAVLESVNTVSVSERLVVAKGEKVWHAVSMYVAA